MLLGRHMTKGQRAMAIAMIYPEPEKGGRGKKSVRITEFGFDPSYLSHARTVLRYSVDGDFAKDVLAGVALSLPAHQLLIATSRL